MANIFDASAPASIVCKYDGCDVTFRSQGEALRHYRIHTDSRPYTCRECNKGFKRQGCLKRHQAVHLEKKPFACAFCDRTFTFKYAVSRHESLHVRRGPRKKNQSVNGDGRSKATSVVATSPAANKCGHMPLTPLSPSVKAALNLNGHFYTTSSSATKAGILSGTPPKATQYTTARAQTSGSKQQRSHAPIATPTITYLRSAEQGSLQPSTSVSTHVSMPTSPPHSHSEASPHTDRRCTLNSLPMAAHLLSATVQVAAPTTIAMLNTETTTSRPDVGAKDVSADTDMAQSQATQPLEQPPCLATKHSASNGVSSRGCGQEGVLNRVTPTHSTIRRVPSEAAGAHLAAAQTTSTCPVAHGRVQCVRCGKEVTASDNPIQISSLVFHPTHFTCAASGARLTLATAVVRQSPNGTVDVFARVPHTTRGNAQCVRASANGESLAPRAPSGDSCTTAAGVTHVSNFSPCVSNFPVNVSKISPRCAAPKFVRPRTKHAGTHATRKKLQLVYHYFQPHKNTSAPSSPRRRSSAPPSSISDGMAGHVAMHMQQRAYSADGGTGNHHHHGAGVKTATRHRVCHRCGKHVHAAENPVFVDGLVYHVKHFTCAVTGKKLSLGSAAVVNFPLSSSPPASYIRASAENIVSAKSAATPVDGVGIGRGGVDVVHHTLAARESVARDRRKHPGSSPAPSSTTPSSIHSGTSRYTWEPTVGSGSTAHAAGCGAGRGDTLGNPEGNVCSTALSTSAAAGSSYAHPKVATPSGTTGLPATTSVTPSATTVVSSATTVLPGSLGPTSMSIVTPACKGCSVTAPHSAPIMYMPSKVPLVAMATADDVARSLLLLRQDCPAATRAH